MEDIKDPLADVSLARITISRGLTTPITVSVSFTESYDSISWEVAGVGGYSSVTGNSGSFTLDGAKVNYNTLGDHVLKLTVEKDGMTYQVNIPFTVVD